MRSYEIPFAEEYKNDLGNLEYSKEEPVSPSEEPVNDKASRRVSFQLEDLPPSQHLRKGRRFDQTARWLCLPMIPLSAQLIIASLLTSGFFTSSDVTQPDVSSIYHFCVLCVIRFVLTAGTLYFINKMRLNCVRGILHVLAWNVVMCCQSLAHRNRWSIKKNWTQRKNHPPFIYSSATKKLLQMHVFIIVKSCIYIYIYNTSFMTPRSMFYNIYYTCVQRAIVFI